MKRSPIKRKTPMRTYRANDVQISIGGRKVVGYGALQVRKRLPRVNRKRAAEKFHRNFDGGIGHDKWIRAKPCCLCTAVGQTQRTPTQAAHAKARGMGGAGGDWQLLVPLCNEHHREQESAGNVRIEARYGVNLVEYAALLAVVHQADAF